MKEVIHNDDNLKETDIQRKYIDQEQLLLILKMKFY